ncbi:hypothetical protein LINPERPRIM_LOCUS3087, partial [Linum perenne]
YAFNIACFPSSSPHSLTLLTARLAACLTAFTISISHSLSPPFSSFRVAPLLCIARALLWRCCDCVSCLARLKWGFLTMMLC